MAYDDGLQLKGGTAGEFDIFQGKSFFLKSDPESMGDLVGLVSRFHKQIYDVLVSAPAAQLRGPYLKTVIPN